MRGPAEVQHVVGGILMRARSLLRIILVLSLGAALQASPQAQVRSKKSDKKTVSSSDFPKTLGPYSQAVIAGGFVFVAGQGADQSEDAEDGAWGY